MELREKLARFKNEREASKNAITQAAKVGGAGNTDVGV